MTREHYPPAERLDVIDRLHGHDVPDPYRWLEDPADPRTARWSAAQDEFARPHLDALPGRDRLGATLTRLLDTGWVGVPGWRAGRAFRVRRNPGAEHPVLTVRELGGDGSASERVLLDPMAIDPSGLTTFDTFAPSREGERLAYQLSIGGDEESLLYVVDVTTGDVLDGPIDRCRYSSVAWLPGGEELYYVRKLPPDEVPDGEEQFHRRVYRHRVGADTATDLLVHGAGLDPTNYYGVDCSADGHWLVVTASPGTAPRNSVWIADLEADGPLRPVLSEADAVRCSAWVEQDGRLYLLTTHGAPRWRLCVADPARPEPANWRELIPEDPEAVLDDVGWVQADNGAEPLLAVARTRHAVTELHLHVAADGAPRARVPLPGTGSMTGLSAVDPLTKTDRGRIWFGWTDFTTPAGVYRFDVEAVHAGVELDAAAPGSAELPAVYTRQVEFTSADGTTVRMFVVAPTEAPDRARPTMLTGYGGFAISREPGYSATALAWVAAGGLWVSASLRGGGEEGEDWHRAGMREHKQRVFDDFAAAADALVDGGWTRRELLSISGGSNGGLLVGAALTQRPDACRAVVCSAPLLDMVRYEQFSIGRTWNDEYGSAADPDELAWLLSYSPYHHVRDGVEYPAVLFTVFESDTRVDPAHARKMCAALQHATAADPATAPILLRRETDVGHAARSISRTVALAVDQLAFLAARTGLDLEVLPA